MYVLPGSGPPSPRTVPVNLDPSACAPTSRSRRTLPAGPRGWLDPALDGLVRHGPRRPRTAPQPVCTAAPASCSFTARPAACRPGHGPAGVTSLTAPVPPARRGGYAWEPGRGQRRLRDRDVPRGGRGTSSTPGRSAGRCARPDDLGGGSPGGYGGGGGRWERPRVGPGRGGFGGGGAGGSFVFDDAPCSSRRRGRRRPASDGTQAAATAAARASAGATARLPTATPGSAGGLRGDGSG